MEDPSSLQIWKQEYLASTFLVNRYKKMGLYGLLNLLQDTAWIHATHAGYGFEDMITEQKIWVLTRQKLVMQQWPDWGDEVQIHTWIRPYQSAFSNRDFVIWNKGEKIGECTTSWLAVDLETRKPVRFRIPHAEEDLLNTKKVLMLETSKIELLDDLITIAEFQVHNSDLDLNGHVNNTRYAQWITDSLPEDSAEKYQLHSYEVNFLAEVKSRDKIIIKSDFTKPEMKNNKNFQFQGYRLADQKTVFVASLKLD